MLDINALLVGIVLGGLGLVLVRGIARAARQRLPHTASSIDHSLILIEYGRKLTTALDHQVMTRVLTEEIPRACRASRAALLLPKAHQLEATGDDVLRLPVSHAAVRWVASAGEAQRADRGRLHELIEQGPSEFAWAHVWVPLMRGVDLRGLWLLGAREIRGPYTPEDLRCLTALGREAAAVLEATRHAEQQRQIAGEMRMLYRQVVAAREIERSRLSRELHDGVLQDLCAVTRDLKALEAQNGSASDGLDNVTVRAGETVNALRAICNDLRPPLLQHDLASALHALVASLDVRSQAPVHIEIAADDLTLPDDVALTVFRITQEALHNAIEHADASEIAVRLTQYPDRLRLTVTDDGCGIAGGVDLARFVADEHFGLAGMRERAAMIGGKLDVQTALDYGTVVIFELPLSK